MLQERKKNDFSRKKKLFFIIIVKRKKICFLLLVVERNVKIVFFIGRNVKIVFIFINAFRNFIIYMNIFFWLSDLKRNCVIFLFLSNSFNVLYWKVLQTFWNYLKIFLYSCILSLWNLLTCRSLMSKVHYRKFSCLFILYVLLLL